jgi:hypothetical protein
LKNILPITLGIMVALLGSILVRSHYFSDNGPKLLWHIQSKSRDGKGESEYMIWFGRKGKVECAMGLYVENTHRIPTLSCVERSLF